MEEKSTKMAKEDIKVEKSEKLAVLKQIKFCKGQPFFYFFDEKKV